MVLEAAFGHVLVDEQPVLVLTAVTDQFHEIHVTELPQEDHLRLHQDNHHQSVKSIHGCVHHTYSYSSRMLTTARYAPTHQPLLVALGALGVPELDGDGLRLEPRLDLVVDGALVHGAEPALAEEVVVQEPLRRRLELRHREHVQVGAHQRHRQLLLRRRAHHVRERQPPAGPHRRRRLALPRARARADLLPRSPAASAQAAAQEGAPRRPLLLLGRPRHR